jgi:serine/threonine protein kinase
MPVDPKRVQDIYLALVAQPDRAAVLDRECAGDAELRQRVEALLRAHDAPGTLLEGPGTQDVPPLAAPNDAVGAVIAGHYKLLQRIGEGGMGAVYMAEQTQPVKRMVALKVVKAGLDTRTVLARFEAERQALALMNHPNIARVLDAGTTDVGQPFFVMELVKGAPLTQFCDDHQLSVADRLVIFQQICQAVQHAHQKGIIHRDLKPSNILVESYDGQPVPKVIDFGLAKAMHDRPLTERSLFTQFGTVLGTPLYMAPEQAELSAIDVDTRADIYALGVILYEMLTGSTPLEKKRVQLAAWDEIRRVIKEEEPPRPSTRLSSSEALPTIAARRHSEPGKLGRFVRGELDWIAMKALAKERDRRYQTANALAADVGRFLNHEPVSAGPPTVRYKLRKFVRRNRGAVAAAGLVLLALVLGIVGTTWGLVRAAQALAAEAEQRQAAEHAAAAEKQAKEREADQRRQAVASQKKAEAAAQAEKEAKDKEAAERHQAEAVATLLESVFRQLDPRAELKGGLGLKEQLVAQLDRAAANLEKEYAGEPLVRARLRNTLGLTQLGLGEWAKAEKLFQAAVAERRPLLGEDHPDTLAAQHNLAVAYRSAGRTTDAIRLHEHVRDWRTKKLGPDHPLTLDTLNSLAVAYRAAGRTADAIQLFEQVRDRWSELLGPDHRDTLAALHNLAQAYRDAGRTADAIPLLEQVRDRWTELLGPDHPHTLTALGGLALAYRDAGRTADAITLLEQIHDRQTTKLGPDHPNTLDTLNDLAAAYWSAKQLDRSVPLFEEILKRRRAKLGPDHPNTLLTQGNLGVNYRDAGRLRDAIHLLEDALDRAKKRPGPFPARLAWVPLQLAVMYDQAQLPAKSEPLYRQLVADSRKRFGAEDPRTAAALAQLGLSLLNQKKWAEAESVSRDCLAIRQKTIPNLWPTFNARSLLGGVLLGQKKYAEAEPLLLEGYEGMKKRESQIPPLGRPRLAEAVERLVQLYEATGRDEQAAAWRKKRDEIKKPPANP